MSRPYTDIMGNKLTADEVRLAIRLILPHSDISPMALHRATRWGIGKASNMLTLLCHAGVVSKHADNRKRSVILKQEDTAVNAALRQLKKGRK